ncbi:signal peptidase II [Cohnella cholangitidis]|uniref:Lipoprotein signal peptidase n=1 Tax=Cohnella cholangitidis TaxID=2598458 RepID=A0A7G5BZF6_9BACL|nr:signal peptidase II [Cohnella cholangitidis]QMV42340.1 signal peptidase II [Cohnella cholangitidis]
MYFYLIIVAAVVIDAATKVAVRMNLELGERTEILGGSFRIVHLVNTGSTGNMFHGWGRVLALLVILMTIAALYWHRKGNIRGAYLQSCVALIIGGAIGNAIDRILFNHVTDFLHFSDAATMNFADIWVFAGILLLISQQIYRAFKPA